MSQEIIDHVKAQFDGMSTEQIILLDETIAIWNTQLSQSDCHIPQRQQKLNKQCKLAKTNVTDPQANYLDQGNSAIFVT